MNIERIRYLPIHKNLQGDHVEVWCQYNDKYPEFVSSGELIKCPAYRLRTYPDEHTAERSVKNSSYCKRFGDSGISIVPVKETVEFLEEVNNRIEIPEGFRWDIQCGQ